MAGIFLSVTLIFYAGIGVYANRRCGMEYYVPAAYPSGLQRHGDCCRLDECRFVYQQWRAVVFAGLFRAGDPGGLAYVLGWTEGFCLVAPSGGPLCAACVYIRCLIFGPLWRTLAEVDCGLRSGPVLVYYVVAQIYGVGLITSRLTGIHFEIGILLGLGGVGVFFPGECAQ